MPHMVLVSDVGQERDALRAARAAGFGCYMPITREQLVRRGRKIWEERLLFGRYFFARWDQSLDWNGLFNLGNRDRPLVKGVFMRVDVNLPSLIRDFEIERIRSREDQHGYVTDGERMQFALNQKVRASVGVMAGETGSYGGPGKGGCDIAFLELFGRKTRIEFAPGVLQAA